MNHQTKREEQLALLFIIAMILIARVVMDN